MTSALTHRGPDDAGIAVQPGVALGMRRLSILDLDGGHQPMWNEDGTLCVVFNGEIYNFADLRAELIAAGHVFRTDHSDTEVLVHGYEEWGRNLPARLDGMFAFLIWEGVHRRLFAARDRFGEKPLYIAHFDGGVALASEIKALLCLPSVSRDINVRGVAQYLAYDYSLTPTTPLRAVEKIPAGHFAFVTSEAVQVTSYWAPTFARQDRDARDEDLVDELDELLNRAVASRMVADVPIGLFLSGGLDSTTVGYYMRRHAQQVRSFSIGFDDAAFDESQHSQTAANILGTEHHFENFSQARVREIIPLIADVLDEPMGDQSILPTVLLSTVTSSSVKVALGGDGSDELLMGYKAFRAMRLAWRTPAPLRYGISGAAHLLSPASRSYGRGIAFARALGDPPASRILSHLGSFKGDGEWLMTPDARAGLVAAGSDADFPISCPSSLRAADATVAAYLKGYLQDDILVKVDRASMAASLEVRAPFLEPALADFALSLPLGAKLRRSSGKFLLRRLMRGRIPDSLIDRPKQGFGVPMDAWLRESLAPLVREALAHEAVRQRGLFEPALVDALVHEHLAGRRNHGRRLWLLVQLELWMQRWIDAPRAGQSVSRNALVVARPA